eukprot:TRINITY_DN1071_c0_g1_i1.p1 TRINITY_DN1071_c0_g1~~TRINITY_DN1071_c0_g1_i1.p1  ORF type:complete len:829 (+),score=169.93 TRINITY_DN1071_c0_g1_i1:129-2615(+)
MLEDGECEVHEFGAMMFNKLKASAGLSDDEEGSEGSSEEEEEKKPKTWSEKAEEKKMKESGPSNVLELEKLEGELKHRLRSESDERLIEMMNQQHSDSDSDGGLEKQIRATEEKLDKNPKCLLETTYWEVIRRHPTYFPHRRGCHVQFLVEGKELFENVYKTLMEAKELIYIVGWAVTPELKLCRDDPDSLTLGELLKKKAAEGVHVALHLWDETLTGLNMVKRGLYKGMETGDEETRRYFKHTGVRCNLSRRLRTKKGWNIPASVVRMAYSHHQKNIICDMPSIFEEDKRMLVSFIGGIDLTTGRWDTPDHPLFYTLDREHKNDFYCAYPGMDPTKGPRMPWHDVACKVFGRAVIDLLRNFEQRWRRQPKYIEMVPIVKRLRSKDGHPLGLYRFDEENMKKFSDLTNPEKWEEHANRLLGRDVWSLQVTRSIDSKAVRLAKFQGSDISIQEAYVKAIGKAKKFIYIENQFFCGSSEWWNKPHYGCTNSVPIAIVDTICEKIRRGEMMRVYIVIPLFPDSGRGPDSVPSQEALSFQFQTMQFMYREIARCLEEQREREAYVKAESQNDVDEERERIKDILGVEIEKEIPKPKDELLVSRKRIASDYLRFYSLGKVETEQESARMKAELEKIVPTSSFDDKFNSEGHKRHVLGLRSKITHETKHSTPKKARQVQERMLRSRRGPIYVHAKLMIIDDDFFILGSANLNQRSLDGTRDTEMCISGWQPYVKESKKGAIQDFRLKLWKQHLGEENEEWEDGVRAFERVEEIGKENWRRYSAEPAETMQGHLMLYPVEVAEDGKCQAKHSFPDFGDATVEGAEHPLYPDLLSM